jgi:DNA recombination protein RmuC
VTVIELLLIAGGLGVGAVVGWAMARARSATIAARERAEIASRLSAHETMEKELARQITERQLETGELRTSLERERVARAQAEARTEAARDSVDAERKLLEDARVRFSDTFKALSADALRQSNTQFLELAQKALEAQLGPRDKAIEGLLKPLDEALRRTGDYVRDLERKRESAYGSLDTRLQELAVQSRELGRETGNLAAALRSSQTRGRWGEIALRKIVELAGMTEHTDFDEQVSVEDDGSRYRPDMVVHLPNRRDIIVDVKAPLDAYQDAVQAGTEEDRQRALGRHAAMVRRHMTTLADKAYGLKFAQSPDLVVMFIPGESFVAAAFEADGNLLVDAMEKRVVVATPTTLFALLLTIAHGWQQQQLAKNAEEVRKLGQDLYERLGVFAAHVRSIGEGLGKAVDSYNGAVGSLERRVLPAARKFRELGIASRDEGVTSLDPIDTALRPITATELAEQLDIGDASDKTDG